MLQTRPVAAGRSTSARVIAAACCRSTRTRFSPWPDGEDEAADAVGAEAADSRAEEDEGAEAADAVEDADEAGDEAGEHRHLPLFLSKIAHASSHTASIAIQLFISSLRLRILRLALNTPLDRECVRCELEPACACACTISRSRSPAPSCVI